MTTEEAIKRLTYAHKYPEEEVREAVREAMMGQHGEFLKRTMYAILQATKAKEEADDNGE